jgi:hypothetical protein
MPSVFLVFPLRFNARTLRECLLSAPSNAYLKTLRECLLSAPSRHRNALIKGSAECRRHSCTINGGGYTLSFPHFVIDFVIAFPVLFYLFILFFSIYMTIWQTLYIYWKKIKNIKMFFVFLLTFYISIPPFPLPLYFTPWLCHFVIYLSPSLLYIYPTPSRLFLQSECKEIP